MHKKLFALCFEERRMVETTGKSLNENYRPPALLFDILS
jgi:hypothetical protein